VIVSCSHPPAPPAPEAQPEETVTPPPAPKSTALPTLPAFKITPIEPPLAKKFLHVYYQHEGIPVPWVEAWLQGKDITVVQRILPGWEESKWPTDGDLYIVEPRSLAILQHLISFAPWPAGEDADALNPIFLGYGFDPDNLISRPWRWTPYVFIQKKPKEGHQPMAWEGGDWFARPEMAWPADEALLQALWKKKRGFSANLELPEQDKAAWAETWASLRASVRDEETCWKDLIQDHSQAAFLPASRRLQAMAASSAGEGDGLLWHAPPCGSLLRIEYLMVRAGGERQAEAFDLAASLLTPERQGELVQATGYLPVRSYLGHVLDALPMPLPGDGWLDRSEFLNNGIPPAEEKAPENPAGPAPSVPAPAAEPQEPAAPAGAS
jgi:hypothetical protein